MRLGKWARLLLFAAPLVAGCGDFWQAPSTTSSTGCTTDCSTATSGNFYILNAGSSPGIVGQSIVSGTLTAISGSPWTLPSVPYAMAFSPNGNLLFVSTLSGVFVYPISGGQLGTATQVTEDAAAIAIGVDTSGQWLVEALQGTGGVTMAAVPIVASTGADNGTEQTASFSITNAAVQEGKLVISEDNANVFVSLGAGGTIVVPFNAGVSSGSDPFGSKATTIAVANSGGTALSVAVDPSDNVFYIGETEADSAGTSGGLRVFSYSSLGSSSLVQASGSPIASGGLAPNSILPAASGGEVYVANGAGTSSAGNITSFALTSSGSTYTIATGSTATAGVQPFSLAVDSTGTFLLAVDSLGSPYFDSFTFDSTTTGLLDAQITANTGSSPIAIVAAP